MHPNLGDHPQLTVVRHRKHRHCVVQSIRHVKISAVGAETRISEDRLLPLNFGGSADTSCFCLRPPFEAS